MTKRIIESALVAIGLIGLACGGGAEAERVEPAETAGMETPPAAVPGEEQERQATVTIPEGAEPTPAPSPPSQPPAEAGPVSDAEVAGFVEALVQLAMLEQQGMARVEAGETQEDVAASLQPQLDGIFASADLTPKRFADIAQQLETDPVLAQRIETQLERRLADASPPV